MLKKVRFLLDLFKSERNFRVEAFNGFLWLTPLDRNYNIKNKILFRVIFYKTLRYYKYE